MFAVGARNPKKKQERFLSLLHEPFSPLVRRGRIQLSNSENAQHFGGVSVATGHTSLAALTEIDFDTADRRRRGRGGEGGILTLPISVSPTILVKQRLWPINTLVVSRSTR